MSLMQQCYGKYSYYKMMNSIQQTPTPKFLPEEKDEVVTQADTYLGEDSQSYIQKIAEILPIVKNQILHQHTISAKLSQGTFTADKMLRLVSGILKVLRTYNLAKNLKSIEKLSMEIGQLRRLLRVDRLFMIFKEFAGYSKKQKLSKIDKFMVAFKILLLVQDTSDILAYLIQLKLVSRENILPTLRKQIADLYFIECLGWLAYHSYEYARSETEEGKDRNRMIIFRYTMDAIVSHNDFSNRIFTIDPKIASCISCVSSLLNLYLVWK